MRSCRSWANQVVVSGRRMIGKLVQDGNRELIIVIKTICGDGSVLPQEQSGIRVCISCWMKVLRQEILYLQFLRRDRKTAT